MSALREHTNGNGSTARLGAGAVPFNVITGGDANKLPFSRPSQSEIVDVILSMHSDLVEYGRLRADTSRDIEPNSADLESLEEHAKAMAEEAYREAYDPTKHENHRLREAEYQKVKQAQPEAELAVSYAAADVVKLEEEMSKAQSNMTSPVTPQVLMGSAVLALSLTIAPTLHDFIFITMRDDVLNWATSLLSALTLGVFITWGLLESDDEGGRRTIRNWLGLAGGIGVPIGLGLLRVANAEGSAEIVFATALTIVEIAIVLLLDSRAASLRVAYEEWAAQQGRLRDFTKRLEAARLHLSTCQERLTELNRFITAHLRLVDELAVRNFNIERIKADAIRSVRDGYLAGIAANRGYLRGLRRAG